MDVLQQGEFILNGMVQVPLFKDEQEAAAFQLAEQSTVALGPFCDGIVELGIQGRNTAFRQILDQFLIIINEDDGNHRTGTDIFIPLRR